MKLINLTQAQELLLNGDVVAIPTETVYGLGGWIHSEPGLKKIFSTKERPFFDPLIIHVDGIESAKKLTSDWTEVHDILAKATWPGPLTLIAKKHDSVNPLITSGLDSVGIRCPRHQMTLDLLSKIEGGVAAPSANKFGKTSPTTAEHVYEEFGDQVCIIDGGPCEVGIESTVVGITRKENSFTVEIYRPGFYTASALKTILTNAGLTIDVTYTQSPVAPGQLKHHYMPNIPLVIAPHSFTWSEGLNVIEKTLNKKFLRPALWHQPESPQLASRELYQKMREFDETGHDIIVAFKNENQISEDWLGIWNRLDKAKSLSL